jgi:hypothetical protein
LLSDGSLHVAHRRAQISATNINVDPSGQPRVLASEHRRAVGDREIRDVVQANLRSRGRHDRQIAKLRE